MKTCVGVLPPVRLQYHTSEETLRQQELRLVTPAVTAATELKNSYRPHLDSIPKNYMYTTCSKVFWLIILLFTRYKVTERYARC